ncbi:204_t:CDS:2 [Paraglomus occultum]|uniref:204_t:CDS:1 n=1 Tax=Paraglomus occultum TaxID=144539 RepID=A0A9N9F4T5_9GLOM|nr:204_t:CDS:2 [Paraglomus occultum]
MFLAEVRGFEPPRMLLTSLPALQAGPFNHLVPKDNSNFSKQIKEVIDKKEVEGDFFATPFTNLEFKPHFSQKVDKEYKGDALLIKDPSQVEKLTETRNIKSSSPYQITFKVVKQQKEGYGEEKGRPLTYEESFSRHGDYRHILEIEPLDLGIEGLPPIIRLVFYFADEINPLAAGNYELTKCELYKSPALENSVGKTFTMGVKEFRVSSKNNTLSFSTNFEYEFGSLTEKKSQDSPENPTKTPPKNDNSGNPPPKPNPTSPETLKNSGIFKVVLIVSIIMVGLIFLVLVFSHYKKRRG